MTSPFAYSSKVRIGQVLCVSEAVTQKVIIIALVGKFWRKKLLSCGAYVRVDGLDLGLPEHYFPLSFLSFFILLRTERNGVSQSKSNLAPPRETYVLQPASKALHNPTHATHITLVARNLK